MSDPVIQEIKSRIDIVPFMQGYIKLSRAGVNWKGLCPFHQEKTPSFMVSPTRQTWHCFGCSKGGDIFAFLMELENLEFADALKILAERAGVELVREDPRLRTARQRMYAVMEEAARAYEWQIGKMPAALAYLRQRGLRDETIKSFRIGFASDSWDALSRHLAGKGFSYQEMADAGLAVKSEKRPGSFYDRFRNRIMFPIMDGGGKVVAFSGRIFERGLKTDEAKYINSPQTLIFDKSRALYAFDKAKEAIRKKNRCVIVEGQMDVVMSHQAGVNEAVAVSGTALTAKHLEIIRRLADTLISSFDADEAGETATRRSLDLAAEYDFARKVAVIPKGKDPADAVLDDPAVWLKAVEESVSITDFFYKKALGKFNLETPEGKKEAGKYLLPEVAKIGNEIERAHWVAEISQLLGIKEDAVWGELRRYQHRRVWIDESAKNTVQSAKPEKLKIQQLEDRILGALFLYPETRTILQEGDAPLVFTGKPHKEISAIVLAGDSGGVMTEPLELVPPEWRAETDRIIFEAEASFNNVKDARAEIMACIREIKRERLRERLIKLAADASEAERAGDADRRDTSLKDFKAVSESLANLDRLSAGVL